MRKATGAKKPSEKSKRESPLVNESGLGEEYYDPARKEDILDRRKTSLDLWDDHRKDPIVAPAKALECLANSCLGLAFGFHKFVVACRRNGFQHRWRKVFFAKDVGRAVLGRRLALLGPVGCGALTYIIQLLECAGEMLGHIASFSSSSSGRTQWLSRRQCRSSPLSLRKRSRRVR